MRIQKFALPSKNNGVVVQNFNKTKSTFRKRISLVQYQSINRKTKQQLLYDTVINDIKNHKKILD